MRHAGLKLAGPCSQCKKECHGFGWFDPTIKSWSHPGILKNSRFYYCCSVECMNAAQRNKCNMKDPTPHEIDSMVDAGIAGGEYLGELGKTDLTSLSSDEWMTFVDTICTVYCYAMRRRAGAEMLIPNDAPINEINGN